MIQNFFYPFSSAFQLMQQFSLSQLQLVLLQINHCTLQLHIIFNNNYNINHMKKDYKYAQEVLKDYLKDKKIKKKNHPLIISKQLIQYKKQSVNKKTDRTHNSNKSAVKIQKSRNRIMTQTSQMLSNKKNPKPKLQTHKKLPFPLKNIPELKAEDIFDIQGGKAKTPNNRYSEKKKNLNPPRIYHNTPLNSMIKKFSIYSSKKKDEKQKKQIPVIKLQKINEKVNKSIKCFKKSSRRGLKLMPNSTNNASQNKNNYFKFELVNQLSQKRKNKNNQSRKFYRSRLFEQIKKERDTIKKLQDKQKYFSNFANRETLSKQNEEKSNTIKKKQLKPKLSQKCNISKRIKTQMDQEQENEVFSSHVCQDEEVNNPHGLTEEELKLFGNRFLKGFQKLRLLGRGGFAIVWLGEHEKSGKLFAIKQICTQNTHETHLKEIWFGTYFFEIGGVPRSKFESHIGIKNLIKLYSYDINELDAWLLYEKCGESLGSALYELKPEKYRNQKIYRIRYKKFYQSIANNINSLKKIILEIASALLLLSQNNIVHSDLKTQNILIKIENSKNNESIIKQVKLIDYGSSFIFQNLSQFSMATPQYMSPQLLNYILQKYFTRYQNDFQFDPKLLDYVKKYQQPYVIDIWALGCVILQLIHGLPLWMSLKTLNKKGEDVVKLGLFAVKGRLFDKIICKQINTVLKLQEVLQNQNYSGIKCDQELKVILKGMLEINPEKRISPKSIIEMLSKSSNYSF